jgi:hypothetical protein
MPHGRVSGNVVLRASVGSTEASDGRLARVGLIDRRIREVTARLAALCTFVTTNRDQLPPTVYGRVLITRWAEIP